MDETTLEQLESGRVADRGLVLFDFGTPDTPDYYGFWTGAGTLSHGGVDYVGAGRLLEISAISTGTDGTSTPLTIRLNAQPDTDLTPDVLSLIETMPWHQKKVVISNVWIHIVTREILAVDVDYTGYINKLVHYTSRSPGKSYIEASLESISRDFTKRGTRKRTSPDQEAFAPTDKSLRHVQKAQSLPIYFGQKAPKSAAAGGAGGPATPAPAPSGNVTSPWETR